MLNCCLHREPSQLYLGMNKIWTAFLVLALGILLCSIAHGIEWIAGGRRRDVFAGNSVKWARNFF